MALSLSAESRKFYVDWRQSYRWPLKNDRVSSERRIRSILNEVRVAFRTSGVDSLGRALVHIHGWKTGQQRGITRKYEESLRKRRELLTHLLGFLPSTQLVTPDFFSSLLDDLRIPFCNLPVCSAQASFLLDRLTPIIDRFVAQFFSIKVSRSILELQGYDMNRIFQDIVSVPFEIEDDGRGICVPRLAVYGNSCYRSNRDLFVRNLLPELRRIARVLNNEGMYFRGIDRVNHEFTDVDVEMAVFAFGTQNRRYFECFYEGREVRPLSQSN